MCVPPCRLNKNYNMSSLFAFRETDMRWDRMCAYDKEHPEEKPQTIGEHLARLNKFGFDLVNTPSEREKRIKGMITVTK